MVTAIVLNTGAEPAQNIVVQVVDISTGRPLPIGDEQRIDAISVGGSGVVQVRFDTEGKLGDFQIRVIVDPNNLIAESDETGRAYEAATAEARSLGIFGAPTFVTRGEIFWGDDRLEDAVRWHGKGTLVRR